MQLQIENIGIIQKADISIPGITVIAGRNGVGKSTVGKALFASLKAFRNNEDAYEEQLIKAYTKEMLQIARGVDKDYSMKIRYVLPRLATDAAMMSNRFFEFKDRLARQIKRTFNEVDIEKCEEILNKTDSVFKTVTKSDLLKSTVGRVFEKVFQDRSIGTC